MATAGVMGQHFPAQSLVGLSAETVNWIDMCDRLASNTRSRTALVQGSGDGHGEASCDH